MIAGHERSVALYRAQAQGGEDQDLRKYARDTLPTIEHHLDRTQEIAEMTRPEGHMLTMRIIKLLGIAGVAVLAAAWLAARVQRREEEQRRRLNERSGAGTLGKRRWRKPQRPGDAERGHGALARFTGNEGRLRVTGYRPLFQVGGPSRQHGAGVARPAHPCPAS